jgi:effector-binding domain-containing protein
MECGFPVAASAKAEARIRSSKLPGGKVATAIHIGPYDRLGDAYSAIESWIKDKKAIERRERSGNLI